LGLFCCASRAKKTSPLAQRLCQKFPICLRRKKSDSPKPLILLSFPVVCAVGIAKAKRELLEPKNEPNKIENKKI
jgi:hypothetical protein